MGRVARTVAGIGGGGGPCFGVEFEMGLDEEDEWAVRDTVLGYPSSVQ